MANNSYRDKGPAPTAQHFEEQRERMRLHRQWKAKDQAELDEYAAAMRSGDEKRAQEIALARYQRSRRHIDQPRTAAAEPPQSVIEAERARGRTDQGTDSDLSPEPLVGPTAPSYAVRHFQKQLTELVAKVRILIPDR